MQSTVIEVCRRVPTPDRLNCGGGKTRHGDLVEKHEEGRLEVVQPEGLGVCCRGFLQAWVFAALFPHLASQPIVLKMSKVLPG